MSDRDWPEDFSDENGNYTCVCSTCGELFVGYKRRFTCKVCAKPRDIEEEKMDAYQYGKRG